VGQYLPVVALMVLAVIFGALSLVVSKLLSPHRTTRAKRGPYESGIVPTRDVPQRFPVHFYLVAMIFIVFDIEIVFLYPWAMARRELGIFGLVAIAIFAASVFESFLYLLSKGALEWGPTRRVSRPSAMVGAGRTSASTIRRVGTEGRYQPEELDVLAALEPRSEATAGAGPSGAPAASGHTVGG
jgi:NADH-quinone oxidoreductase subunit A